MNISKILTILVAVIAVIGIVLFANVSAAGEDAEALSGAVAPLVGFSTLLLYAAIGVTIILSLLSLIKNPENLKKTLMGLVALAVVLLIAYFLGDSNAVLNAQGGVIEGGEAGAASNKWASTGIWFATLLGVVGAGFFVVDLVKGIIKS
ncbi:hypothetical protein OD91_1969 [Lutibacter sp. Hel_I_33_5]|uniref:hypothetical protein n=1 Tax=Lutibacter sp. Hel_I_33_5 TaxID=1566289 RepID=UPI0011AA2D45|nr:hypothetical protein [Lutibacter sp. Hel_I_33_5]TVZ56673.1 hypothetical protein OD91_1969 [Lutibacter sp. Hel_I_33_5]